MLASIYLVALVATMPAAALSQFVTIPSQVTALYGTVRHGRATLDGGYALSWDHRAGDLLRLRATADLTLTGADTALTGRIGATPFATVAQDISGRAGPGLLELVPGLAIEGCSTQARVDIARLALSSDTAAAEGALQVDAGTCTETNGRVDEVPALDVRLDTVGPDARIRVTSQDTALAEIVVRGDRVLNLTLQPEGSALIPGLPTGAPITVSLPF